MGILDGIVEWIAKQVMNGLDLISTSVLGALGCDMGTFLRYFPAAETMYKVFVATTIGLVLLNWVWQLFKNFGLIAGVEAEDSFRLSIRSVLFIGLIYYCDQITDMVLSIGGTPYSWILSSDLPPLNFADFNSVLLTILGVCASGSVTLIALVLLLILAWNYIKLLFEAAERYVLLGVVVYTAPMAFATGASQSMTVFAVTESDVEVVGKETAAGNVFIWFLCAIAFLKISQKIDSFLSSLGINVGHTGGNIMAELMVATRGLTTAKNIAGGSSFRGGSVRMGGSSSSVSQSSFLSGGLAGAVGRHFTQSAMHTMTGHSSNPISRRAFESSVKKGGDFANGVTGAVAKGNTSYTGSMTGTQALTSYMGQTGILDTPSYSDVEIGGGRIMGTETSVEYPNGTAFGMYNTEQYMTVTTADNATWYKQYAVDTLDRTSYMTGEGKIVYHEDIVQKLPNMPKRKDRV